MRMYDDVPMPLAGEPSRFIRILPPAPPPRRYLAPPPAFIVTLPPPRRDGGGLRRRDQPAFPVIVTPAPGPRPGFQPGQGAARTAGRARWSSGTEGRTSAGIPEGWTGRAGRYRSTPRRAGAGRHTAASSSSGSAARCHAAASGCAASRLRASNRDSRRDRRLDSRRAAPADLREVRRPDLRDRRARVRSVSLLAHRPRRPASRRRQLLLRLRRPVWRRRLRARRLHLRASNRTAEGTATRIPERWTWWTAARTGRAASAAKGRSASAASACAATGAAEGCATATSAPDEGATAAAVEGAATAATAATSAAAEGCATTTAAGATQGCAAASACAAEGCATATATTAGRAAASTSAAEGGTAASAAATAEGSTAASASTTEGSAAASASAASTATEGRTAASASAAEGCTASAGGPEGTAEVCARREESSLASHEDRVTSLPVQNRETQHGIHGDPHLDRRRRHHDRACAARQAQRLHQRDACRAARGAHAAETDDAVRCVVLTGEGRAFSAGQDLSEDRVLGPDGKVDFGARLERDYNPLVERIYAFPKVTIAALNGPTVGASANIALACDILLAARSAYLQEAFAKIALVPDAGGTWSLPRIVGAKRALALMLTADQIPADELQRMGLVYKVFDDAAFADEVAKYARRFASGPAMTYRLIKEAARVSEANDLRTQLALEANLQRKAGASEDATEGVTAFREKRPPRYKGR